MKNNKIREYKSKHGNEIGEFGGVFALLISFFIGFCVPLMLPFKFELDSRPGAEAVIYMIIVLGGAILYKKVAIKDKRLLDDDWLFHPKAHFKRAFFFYIYVFYDFILIPFLAGLLLSSIFFV